MRERITISLPEEDVEDLDHILDVKEMTGERDNDRRSPLFKELVEEYIEENQADLRRWEAIAEGNLRTRMAVPAE